jgi:hypothetical protein
MGNKQMECKKCGEVLTPHISTVKCGSDCRECGRYSYRADQPSYLYLLTNQQLKLHKIGIGSVGRDKGRLEQLVHDGWIVHGIWHNSDDGKTYQWEAAIFKQLAKEISTDISKNLGLLGRKDRHWVEGVSAEAITISALENLISKVVLR